MTLFLSSKIYVLFGITISFLENPPAAPIDLMSPIAELLGCLIGDLFENGVVLI
jgi:hypothetical protein